MFYVRDILLKKKLTIMKEEPKNQEPNFGVGFDSDAPSNN